jgi:F-type H+-transporting ATPase subunit epsilon|uniref:ATP synthase epsilon chain, chloroplastic n=1 Tax=Vaucheria litorea TaxID=109269 RepID=B7T1R1_VAULI|nr:ATP synthase CF1 subunit e [Vaucheria litorea]ACF70877.1 ATP synthase CF1 subunit e [Vaucheria litorea]
MSIILSITIPNEIIYKNTIEEVILPSLTGQIGVLTDHTAAIVALDIGIVRIKETSLDNWIPILILGGLAEIENNIVRLVISDYEKISKDDYQKDLNELEVNNKKLMNITDSKEKIKISTNIKRIMMRLEGHRILI